MFGNVKETESVKCNFTSVLDQVHKAYLKTSQLSSILLQITLITLSLINL